MLTKVNHEQKDEAALRNQVNLAQEPEQVFLNPWADDGVTLLAEPPYFWQASASALIEGVGASESDLLNDKIEAFLTQTRRHRKFKHPIVYASVPAIRISQVFHYGQ